MSLFPLTLTLPEESDDLGEALQSIKEQLRRVPQRGIGYGLLRYLNQEPAIAKQLKSLPQAEVVFNYLGQVEQMLPDLGLFSLSQGLIGSFSPQAKRAHLLDISAFILDGALQIDWTYSENLHRRETIQALATDFVDVLYALI